MPLAFATPEAAKGVSQGSLLELTGVIAEEGEGMYADSEGDLYERWVLCYAFFLIGLCCGVGELWGLPGGVGSFRCFGSQSHVLSSCAVCWQVEPHRAA